MPELIGEPLEQPRAENLRLWLAKPEGQTLRTVIAAKLRLKQEEALKAGMRADDANSYDLKASAEMKEAHRFQIALSVIEHIADTNTPLETIKLKT